MPYDAVKMADWQISEAAEKNMPTPEEWKKMKFFTWAEWPNLIF